MKWTYAEKTALLRAHEDDADGGVLAVATRAVDLVAARGGTMTAGKLQSALDLIDPLLALRISEHIAALGARLAVVEAELAESAACVTLARDEMDKARQSEAVWRKRMEEVVAELADVAPGVLGRLDVLGRVKMLKAHVSALQAAGGVLSAHVDKTAGGKVDTLGIALESAFEGYDDGAEAMRAACLESAQEALHKHGCDRSLWEDIKAAIEGATP